jgi:D-alanyl-lipoteichoic acid acyltransferase DltB (MBOAT superfamily)
VFFPLERKRVKYFGQPLNILIVFFLTGLWHGANWTFVVWGLLHGFYLVLSSLIGGGPLTGFTKRFFRGSHVIEMTLTFLLISFTWIFFRASDVSSALSYLNAIFSSTLFNAPNLPSEIWHLIVLIIIFQMIEWNGRAQSYAIAQVGLKWSRPLRWTLYYLLVFLVLYNAGQEQQFIYFQF